MILLGFFLITTVYSSIITGTPDQLWKIQTLKVPQPVLQQFKAPDELEKKVLSLFTQDVSSY